jgi:hypothetical protein
VAQLGALRVALAAGEEPAVVLFGLEAQAQDHVVAAGAGDFNLADVALDGQLADFGGGHRALNQPLLACESCDRSQQ